MLLLRKGDKAMISEAAAKPMAIIAVVAGSMEKKFYRTILPIKPTRIRWC